MKRRGVIDELPSGKFRARAWNERVKRYAAAGTWATREEAQHAIDTWRSERPPAGLTLAGHGESFLPRRRLAVTDWAKDEDRWRVYIERDELGRTPLRALRRRHVVDWLEGLERRGLAPQTRRNALNLLRASLADALDRELIAENPARDVRVKKRHKDAPVDDVWTILDPDEQLALLNAVPVEEWHTVAFALGAGVRNTEQWSLLVEDFDLESRLVVVKRGKPGLSTKTGRARELPLFGVALDAAREALERQKKSCPYAFPSPRTNTRRYPSSHPSGWHAWVQKAKIGRSVRWYDLRHTCATSLLAGWWGRKWTLDELAKLLGHTSTKTTERYAHKLDETLRAAGRSTGFHGVLAESANSRASFGIRTRDLRFTNPRNLEGFSGIAVENYRKRSTERDDQLAGKLLEATRLAYQTTNRIAQARVRHLLREAAEHVA